MVNRLEHVSGARVLAGTTSLFGLGLLALPAIFPAALTIFSGIGFFLAAVIIAWLWAAWQESRDPP